MSGDKLVRMANDIARFFAAYPPETAVLEIRHHIEAFWPRRMRQDALAAMEAGEDRFDPLVVAAFGDIRGTEPPCEAHDGGC